MERQKRQEELRGTISKLRARQQTITDDVKNLVVKREEHTNKLETLRKKHFDACRGEALGQQTDLEKIERDIAATSAKVSGTQTLIAEKQREIGALGEQRAPFEHELAKLVAEENRDRGLAEVAQSFNQGKDELKQVFILQKSHVQRVVQLRSKYDNGDDVVRRSASEAAEKLDNARNGVRVQETFTPEELNQIKGLLV